MIVLVPNLLFDLFGIARINDPFVMSGLGVCIGLYGYGSGWRLAIYAATRRWL